MLSLRKIFVNCVFLLFSRVTEYLPGFGGDRVDPAVAEKKFTIGPETKKCCGCYPLLAANSGERAY